MTNRPTGIAILAILLILGGASSLLGIFSNILIYGIVFASISAALGVVNVILGISLWGMKPWSRMAAIIMQIVGLGTTVVMFGFMGGMEIILPGMEVILIMAMIPGLFISLIVIVYLMQGSMKDAFENPVATDTW